MLFATDVAFDVVGQAKLCSLRQRPLLVCVWRRPRTNTNPCTVKPSTLERRGTVYRLAQFNVYIPQYPPTRGTCCGSFRRPFHFSRNPSHPAAHSLSLFLFRQSLDSSLRNEICFPFSSTAPTTSKPTSNRSKATCAPRTLLRFPSEPGGATLAFIDASPLLTKQSN